MGIEQETNDERFNHLARKETPIVLNDPQLVEQKAREEGVITDSTRLDLQRLKDRIESGDIDESLVGALLDQMSDMPPEKHQEKPVILGVLLTSLHQKGIRFGGFKKGGITLIPDTSEEAQKYEVYLNGALKKGTFQKSDFQKALLYSTSEMQAYLPEMDENPSIGSYVVSLLNKYQIEYKGVTVSKSGETKIPKPSESSYATFRDFLEHRIPDRADSDFLVAYFDDVFYKDGAGFSGKYLSDYKKMVGENQGELATAFRELNHEQRQVMGVTTSADVHNKTKQYAANPKQFFIDSLQGGGVHAGIIFGIIGALFFGKKGAFGGLLMGLIGGVVSPAEAGSFIAGMFDDKQKPAFRKYRDQILEKRNGLDKDKTEMTYTALMQNEKFQVKSAKNIYIFEKTSLEQKEFFESCGIWLNDENTPILKHIFTRIIATRKAEGIEPKDEQMKEYLNRKPEKMGTSQAPAGETPVPQTPADASKTPDGKVVAGAVAGTVATQATTTPQGVMGDAGMMSVAGGETITEKEGQILEYFAFSLEDKLKVNAFFDRLKSRGIDLSLERFLGAYKNYIEQNTHSLYQANLKEATKRRILDTINGIDLASMEKKEMNDFGTLREFKQNKRIIDARFDKEFADFDTTVLPTATLLKQILDERGELKPGIQLNEDQQNKLKEAKEMFSSELLEDGRFNNSQILPRWGNITGVFSNEWLVFGAGEQVGPHCASEVPPRGLLSPEDQALKTRVGVCTFIIYATLAGVDVASFVPGWALPGFAVGAVYGGFDTLSDEELALKILKKMNMIPEDYRTEKDWGDRAMAAISMSPLVWKGGSKVVRKLSESELKEAMKFQSELKKMLPGFKDRITTTKTNLGDLRTKVGDFEVGVKGREDTLQTAQQELQAITSRLPQGEADFLSVAQHLKINFGPQGFQNAFPNHIPQDIPSLLGKSDFIDGEVAMLFHQAGIPQVGPHNPTQIAEIQNIYTQVATRFDAKLQDEFKKVNDYVKQLYQDNNIPLTGPHSADQLTKIDEILSQATREISEKYPEATNFIFPQGMKAKVGQHLQDTQKLPTAQQSLDTATKELDDYKKLNQDLLGESQRLEGLKYWGDRGWFKNSKEVENMKHMFDELLSAGTEVEISGMKFSKDSGKYVCKDPVTGNTIGEGNTFLEMISHQDVHLNPMEVFSKFSKQKLATDAEALSRVNKGLLKNVSVEDGGKQYVFQFSPSTQDFQVHEQQASGLALVTDAKQIEKVMEAFRVQKLPKIVDDMYESYIKAPLDVKIAGDVLKKIYNTFINKSGGGITMTFEAFKKLPIKDFIKMSADFRRTDSIGTIALNFGKNWKTTAKNIFIANTGTALLYSGVEAGYDKYVKEGEGNYWGDVGDRWVDYAIATIPLTELLRFFDLSPSEIAGGILFGNK